MPKFHYSVHVISRTPNVDVTLWVGVNLDEKYESDESFVPDDSVLGKAAIAQARNLCPALKDCTCEEWCHNYEPDYSDDIHKFLGDDYAEKAEKLKRLAKPLFNALDKTEMQLAIDSRNENHLIVETHRKE
jgi:hypothetical protein